MMRRSRRLVAVCVCALLAGCAGLGPKAPLPSASKPTAPKPSPDMERDRAPDHVPFDLALLPDPVPTREPPSRYGNHSPYTVWGRSYRVMDQADGYSATGIASWYGAKFHGRRTSSGEPYDMYKLTAAHRYLPLPNYARVTNLDNGRSVIVRVNDRGPFHEDRIIDLSYAAAVRLGFADRGTARVKVEVVTPPPEPQPLRTAAPAAAADNGRVFLQAGAFADAAAAQRLRASLAALLASAHGDADAVHIHTRGSDGLFRVWIGPVAHAADAVRLQELIAAADFAKPIVIQE
jgi:rare lipoprotein A